MNNPLPRTSLLARSLAKTPMQRAAEIETKLNPKEEAKANALVAQILESAVERKIDSEIEEEHSIESTYEPGIDYKPATQSATRFQLPAESESGLWNPDITLDESQVEAVAALAKVQYGCLIGAAGTGKTTVQKYLIHKLVYGDSAVEVKQLSDGQGLNIAMVAFTGMAVQVMKSNLPSWMHQCCKTIHGLLEFAPEQVESTKSGQMTRIFVPQRHNLRKLDHDIIIIDEASMVGLDLWKQLLAACKRGTRIYMTGDLNQLPPIIGQPIFAYALSHWHVSELTKVHRQKEVGANRIVEVAHQVLNGKQPSFDNQKGNPDWRVIFQELPASPVEANKMILNILNQIRKRQLNPADPNSAIIYDPYRDRVMTAGNGFDNNKTSSMVQQAPLNEQLSILIQPPDEAHPRFIIDAGRAQKKFAVNLRVMATKNEAPSTLDRVTNGMTGVITDIVRNGHYKGKYDLFGIESEVMAATRARIADLRNPFAGESNPASLEELANFSFDSDEGEEDLSLESGESQEEIEGGGAASHIVHVRFDNGAVRQFASKASVESLQLAYCSTVAKCQGSQFDCAVIICHHAEKAQLSREWLYTAITRATKRVIILGTPYAIRYAISRQKIKGATLADKIERYRAMAQEGLDVGYAKFRVNVPLSIETYDLAAPATVYSMELES